MIDRLEQWLAGFVRDAIALADRMRTPERLAGLGIVVVWTLVGLGGGLWFFLGLAAGLVAMHVWTVESGSNMMLWLMTAALVLVLVMSGLVWTPPLLVVTVAGFSIVAHNEAVRLSHGRRRGGVVDETLLMSSVGSMAVVGMAAVVATVVAAAVLDDSRTGTWLWMATAAGVLFCIGMVVMLVPTRGASSASKNRWTPGERIPPQPVGLDDDRV